MRETYFHDLLSRLCAYLCIRTMILEKPQNNPKIVSFPFTGDEFAVSDVAVSLLNEGVQRKCCLAGLVSGFAAAAAAANVAAAALLIITLYCG